MSDVLTSKLGGLFIQKNPGEHPEWLACGDLDTITIPKGDQTLVQCINADGEYAVVGTMTAAPGNASFTIKSKVFPESDALDSIIDKDCDVGVFALVRDCGRKDDFTGWKRGFVMEGRLTSTTDEGLVMASEEKEVSRSLEFTARKVDRVRAPLTVARQTIADTVALNDIAFCNLASCGGQCGNAKDLGTDGFIARDLGAGSPADDPHAPITDDGGANWADSAGAPFSFVGDAGAAECFRFDSSTTRWLLARKPVAAEMFEIAYSDDSGATWTQVHVGSTANEGVTGAGGLFALDKDHIWAVTSAGNVYFSANAGASWTVQSTGLTASGGNDLNAVHFADADNGYAVGDADTLIHTTDGATWAAVTAPTTGDNLTSLTTFNRFDFVFGTNSGELYTSADEGVTFTAQVYPGQLVTDTVKFLSFVTNRIGFMAKNTVGSVGTVLRTIDGAHTWETLTTPANSGLNSIEAIDKNTAFVVGEANGGTGFVAKVSAS